jgi:hypothetical protein
VSLGMGTRGSTIEVDTLSFIGFWVVTKMKLFWKRTSILSETNDKIKRNFEIHKKLVLIELEYGGLSQVCSKYYVFSHEQQVNSCKDDEYYKMEHHPHSPGVVLLNV